MTEMPDQLLTANDYEAWAAQHLDRPTFDFVAGGAGAELTLEENTAAFRRMRPRSHARRIGVPHLPAVRGAVGGG